MPSRTRELEASGKTGGSRRKYYNASLDAPLWLDEPHGKEMTIGMVKRLQKELRDRDLL